MSARIEWLKKELEELKTIIFDFCMENEIAANLGEEEAAKDYREQINLLRKREALLKKMLDAEENPTLDFQATMTITLKGG